MARKHHTVGQRFIPYRTFVGSMIPNNLMRFKGLSANAKLVCGRLAQYAGRDGLCHPSYKMLGAECGISKRQAISIIKELISKGFIEKTVSTDRERQRCIYDFLWHPCFEGDSISPAGDIAAPQGEAEFTGVGEASFTQRESIKKERENMLSLRLINFVNVTALNSSALSTQP